MIKFRKADKNDIDAIAQIYDRIHDAEEAAQVTIGWNRSIYPTRKTAEDVVALGEMFVELDDDKIVAAARFNKEQVHPAYDQVAWEFDAKPEDVMVMHTLVVDPTVARKGYGRAFAKYYEEYALENGCHYLRIDTNMINVRARQMYASLGYREAGIVPTVFNGIPGVMLVCLEKEIRDSL